MFVDRVVDRRDLCQGAVRRVHLVELGGRADRGQFGDDAPCGHREGGDVVVALREHLDLALAQGDAADLVRGLDRRDEPQAVIAFPDDIHGVVVEIFGQVAHLGRGAVVEEQAGLVRLVARAPLREEGDLPVVGRPDGILVVAREVVAQPLDLLTRVEVRRLADVLRLSRSHVVDEDVRVGRYGVGRARERLAGVGQHRSGMVPGDLGHVEVGGQWGVPCRIGADDVHAGLQAVGPEVAHEDVEVFALIPIVPVADHQVVVDAGLRFVHVGVDVRRTACGRLYALHIPRLVAAGRDAESLDVALQRRQLARVTARGAHLPHLHRAAAVREEEDLLSVGAPARGEAVRRGVGQPHGDVRREVLDPDGRHAAVLLHVVVGLLVEERLSVGRECGAAGPAHFPHHLGGEDPGGDLLVGQPVVDCQGCGSRIVAGAQPHSCNSHRQKDFFHFRSGFPIYS